MALDAIQDLATDYRDFDEARFPKLGYTVDGFPEADSILAGLILRAISHKGRIVISETPIVDPGLAEKVATACQARAGSQDAVELETYFAKMKGLESKLRQMVSLQKEE